MGFIAPAVPWIAKGASLLGGFLGARKAQSSAMQRSPEEQTALKGAQGAGGELASTGADLTSTGQANVAGPTNYYQTLLHGNRAAQAQATAAPRAAITDVYSGAQRNLERSGVRGAAKDVLSGDLARDQAAKVSSLVTGVQPAAAAALTDIGQTQTGMGGARTGAAGSIYSNLLPQGYQNRVYGRQEGEKAGSTIGGFLFDILRGVGGKKSSSAVGMAPGDFASDAWYNH